MAMYLVGETVEEGFSTDVPHETFTIVESRDPDGLDFFTSANITELGTEGQYLVSFLAGKPGNYFAHWRGDLSHVDLDGNWEIEGGSAETAFASNTSRLGLRQRIGGPSGLADMIPVVAAAGSTDVTFVDPARITLPTGAYLGRELYAYTGANAGQSRQVRGSGELSTSLTVAPAFLYPFALGDRAEIWNTSGSGWHAYEVNLVINEIVQDARSGFWVPTNVTVADRFDATRPYINIPAQLTHIIGVAAQDDGGVFQEIGPADYPGGPGWYVDSANQSVRLGGDALWGAANRTMQVRGYAALAELDQDSDTTPLSAEWIVKEGTARLLYSGLSRRPINQILFPAAQRRADQARGFAMTRPHSNMTRVIA